MSTDISASAAYVASPVIATRAAAASATSQAVTSIASNAAAAPHPSPVSLLDPSTGLVVLEFYNAKGVETSSLPTKKALENYRQNEQSNSVFQPAIHDGTVPPPSTSDKSSAGSTVNGSGAIQATATVQASGSATAQTSVAQPTIAVTSSSTGSFATHA